MRVNREYSITYCTKERPSALDYQKHFNVPRYLAFPPVYRGEPWNNVDARGVLS